MKITSVEPQKKSVSRRTKRFNVFLDGVFVFGADEDLVVDYRLIIGKEISGDILEKIIFDAEVGKLMERLYRLSNLRMHSEKEIKDYLKRLSFKRKTQDKAEISEIVISQTIEKAKQKGIIDDQQFAKAWVYARSKKYGPQRIKQELFQKGINREIMEEVMGSGFGVHGQEEIVTQALEKKINSWKNLEPMKFRKKAYEYLLRKGFRYETVKLIVEKYLKKS